MTEQPRPAEISIRNACPKPWAALEGEGSKRYCGECRLFVHDASALTRAQAHALARTEGERVCMRIVMDAGGQPIYRDSPARVGRLAHWALAAGLTLSACQDDASPAGAGGSSAPAAAVPPVDAPIEVLGEAQREILGDVAAPTGETRGEIELGGE